MAGTDRPLGDVRPRQIDIAVDGMAVQTLVIPADQGEVMQQVDLSAQVARGNHHRDHRSHGNRHRLPGHAGLPRAGADHPQGAEPLWIELVYDKTALVVDDR